MQNAPASPDVSLRPARRSDLAGLRSWGRHPEPFLADYNVPRLGERDLDEMWRLLNSPGQALYHAFAGDALIAQIKLRAARSAARAELGITMDPRFVGRGLGSRILREMLAIAFDERGFQSVGLEVAGYNQRALAAYRKAGFVETSREWFPLDSRIDFGALLAQPEYEWLREWVRVRPESTSILVLAMEARKHV